MADKHDDTRIVIDNGTVTCRYGLAGEDSPEEIPTLISKCEGEPVAFGEEARTHPQGFTCPIENSLITDWDAMEALWSHIMYHEMKVKPEERAVLLTEPVLNPKAQREKMVQIMFEKFNVPKTYIANAPTLALYGYGRTTGLVVDSGENSTSIVPIYEGYALPHAINRFIFGGAAITDILMNRLKFTATSSVSRHLANKIKEEFVYLAADYDTEIKRFENDPSLSKSYILPDGTAINIGRSAFQCSEVLFRPSIGGRKCVGLDQDIHGLINKTDCDVRNDLYANIVLSGGTSMIPGFKDRLCKGLAGRANETQKIDVKCMDERKNITWIGGSILASLHTFREMWIPKYEYEEHGPTVVHRFCF